MSLLRSFCTPYGAPGSLYYDSYEFFNCGPQAELSAWRKLAVIFFPNQIQIQNSLGWFLTLWPTHSCKNQLVANFFPDGTVLMLIVPNYWLSHENQWNNKIVIKWQQVTSLFHIPFILNFIKNHDLGTLFDSWKSTYDVIWRHLASSSVI